MATPIGHALAGYAVYSLGYHQEKEHRTGVLWACLILAIIPDLDFLPGIVQGQPALYHQGITHSFSFAAGAGLLAVFFRPFTPRRILANWLVFFFAYSSHLLVDFFGPDFRPPIGIPLFWPITDQCYIAPNSIFWGVRHVSHTSASNSEWLAGIFDSYNLWAIGIEVSAILPFIFLAWVIRARKFSQ